MDERWAFPIPMTMQRQAGSPPKPLSIKSPPVAPSGTPCAMPGEAVKDAVETEAEIRFDY